MSLFVALLFIHLIVVFVGIHIVQSRRLVCTFDGCECISILSFN